MTEGCGQGQGQALHSLLPACYASDHPWISLDQQRGPPSLPKPPKICAILEEAATPCSATSLLDWLPQFFFFFKWLPGPLSLVRERIKNSDIELLMANYGLSIRVLE